MRKIVRSVFFMCTVVTVFSLLGSEQEEKKQREKGRGWSVLTVADGGDDGSGIHDLSDCVASRDDDSKDRNDEIQIELAAVNPEDPRYNQWLDRIDDNVTRCWPALLTALYNHHQLNEPHRDYINNQLKKSFCRDTNPCRPYAISPDGELVALWFRGHVSFIKPKKQRLEVDSIYVPLPPRKMKLVWDLSKPFYRNDYMLVTQKNNSIAKLSDTTQEHLPLMEHLQPQVASVTAWRIKRSWLPCSPQKWHGKTFYGSIRERPIRLFCDAGGTRALLTFGVKDNETKKINEKKCEVYVIEANASNAKSATPVVLLPGTISKLWFENTARILSIKKEEDSETVEQYGWDPVMKTYLYDKQVPYQALT